MSLSHLLRQKWYNLNTLMPTIERWRQASEKIIFTNGCFDILHAGHITYLTKAASLGDKLIIGLNSDSSVKKIKGQSRPIQNQADRALILAALSFVSAVIIFEEENPAALVSAILPDILVKGSDYKWRDIAGSSAVLEHGGSIVLLPFLEGRSTTSILSKLGIKEKKF